MSWNGYIDNLLAQSKGQADKACIIGIDGAKWTTDDHNEAIKLAPNELMTISRCFKSKDFTAFQAGGVIVDGTKYQFLRSDDKIVLAKKKDHGAITLQCSKTAIVIGHCPEGKQQGDLNTAVAVIAEYLEGLNM